MRSPPTLEDEERDGDVEQRGIDVHADREPIAEADAEDVEIGSSTESSSRTELHGRSSAPGSGAADRQLGQHLVGGVDVAVHEVEMEFRALRGMGLQLVAQDLQSRRVR